MVAKCIGGNGIAEHRLFRDCGIVDVDVDVPLLDATCQYQS